MAEFGNGTVDTSQKPDFSLKIEKFDKNSFTAKNQASLGTHEQLLGSIGVEKTGCSQDGLTRIGPAEPIIQKKGADFESLPSDSAGQKIDKGLSHGGPKFKVDFSSTSNQDIRQAQSYGQT